MAEFLTDNRVKSAKCAPGQSRLEIFDTKTPGLCLRVSGTKRSWTFSFTAPGDHWSKRARLALGTYPATSLDAARDRATEAKGKVEAGKDPRIADVLPVYKTMNQLMDERLEMEVTGKLRTAVEITRRYDRNIRPLVGTVPVKDFDIDPHYNLVIDPFIKAGKLRTAGVLHTDLITLMDFAKSRGIKNFNLEGTKSHDPKTVRERWLSLAEIPLFWNALPAALARSRNCQRILRLCLVTGQRVGEVAGMARDELDLKAKTWLIPAERAKNGHAHLVPLSELALSVIREAMAVNSNTTDWLFPNVAGDDALDAHVVSTTLRRAIQAGDFAIPQFTAHDLRRTMATQMSLEETGLQVSELIISHILNHRSISHGTITAQRYNKNAYLAEKRDALDRWGVLLADLVGAQTGLRVAA